MTQQVSYTRWRAAQTAESSYWNSLTIGELLRLCAEKGSLIDRLDKRLTTSLFNSKDVLEIGVGPLGISAASFYPDKNLIHRLVKVDPLSRVAIADLPLAKQAWARKLLEWAQDLSEEGEFVRASAEDLKVRNVFDTVVCYNVLDHVGDPKAVLQGAHASLRAGGQILLAVDCLSLVGRLRFEYLTRRTASSTILVQAHPHSFRPSLLIALLKETRFRDIRALELPSLARRIAGRHYRPAFVGTKS